jgi:hypothetical protein
MHYAIKPGGSDWNEEAFDLLMQLLYEMLEDSGLSCVSGNPQARVREYMDMTAQLSFLKHLFSHEPEEHATALSQKMEEAHLMLIQDLNLLKKQNNVQHSRLDHLVRQRAASIIARNNF